MTKNTNLETLVAVHPYPHTQTGILLNEIDFYRVNQLFFVVSENLLVTTFLFYKNVATK